MSRGQAEDDDATLIYAKYRLLGGKRGREDFDKLVRGALLALHSGACGVM
jgi:hypothetical protein